MPRATLADFRAGYPEFADTDDALIERYLVESAIWVGPNWLDDEARGNMLYVAHVITDDGESADLSRTTSIGSGSHKATYKDTDALGFSATRFGVLLLALRGRYSGGFIIAI